MKARLSALRKCGSSFPEGERSRILAIDDDPDVLRYLRRLLDEAGYQAIVASEPWKVNSLVELEEPDLALLDLMLPGSSGHDLMQRIREFSGAPVIFLTGRDTEGSGKIS